ncbi:putative hydrolase [Anaerobacterium chartisolvens]|uniref:Putative hydrolase n=1 Tax=Anaerobacterium chartisolvens TaxID=1297424 RepID=A0A369ASP4_9FIRM|nr:phosphatase [Anaerobacterium chartisolvens]RCX11286.1 putative hydrolase [Anaerobacterium chartisolvens]
MEIIIDTHTHTVSSGHAYSTIQEMARGARDKGIKMIAMTDHGPSMGGAPHLYHFGNLRVIPDEICGVRVLKGVEANIIDYDGNTDMPDGYLKRLEYTIASFHDICIAPSTVEDHTRAMINVLKNPYIDAVAHPGNPQFQVDIDRVVMAAKEYNKLIEINNHSFYVRTGSERNCKTFALKCKEYGVKVVCGSDSHISFSVGSFENVHKILDEVGMPEDLVMCTSIERFNEYLSNKQNFKKYN